MLRVPRSVAALVALALVPSLVAAACDRRSSLPAPSPGTGGGNVADAGDDSLLELPDGTPPPPPDASGYCGNEVHPFEFDATNVYFVLDASGSMLQAAGGKTRFQALRDASIHIVRTMGPLIRVGAAVFPRNQGPEACGVGEQVMPLTPGDPYDGDNLDGPTTVAFKQATAVDPGGGTPVSPTLDALAPTLTSLPGRTVVILATDGGPNCNAEASCGIDTCQPNIEGSCSEGDCCGTNCCAPNGPFGPESCIDEPGSVFSLDYLNAAGIDTYVVGIPGSELYAGVLDSMALAGGAAQFVSPHYYKVDDLSDLQGVLSSIASLVVSCSFTLASPPEDPTQTNVYFDDEVVLYDPENGWYWQYDGVVGLAGEACQRLKSGQVKQVQIVSGCPTEVPN
jgi:hypothetical protein